jgi:hypothetical protein
VTDYAAQVLEQDGTVRVDGSVSFTGSSVDQPVNATHGVWIPPTSDPAISGAVWNDDGTLTISEG